MLVVALSLTAGVSSAQAEILPENLTPPSVTAVTPQLGVPEVTSNGTWEASPAPTFTYAWQRCNTNGLECSTISGATTEKYTPVTADIGHTLISVVTAKNKWGSNTAYSKPTNPLSVTQYWYVGGSKLAFGTPTNVTLKGSGTFTLKWKLNGATFQVDCSTLAADEAKIENVNGSANTLSEYTLFLNGCSTPKLKSGAPTCTVPQIVMATRAVTGESLGKSAVKFSPATGSGAFTVQLNGECAGGHGTTYEFSGGFNGISNSATSSLELTEKTSELTIGGNSATLAGTMSIETTGGKTVAVQP